MEALIPRYSVVQMVNAYTEADKLMKEGYALLAKAEELMQSAFEEKYRFEVLPCRSYSEHGLDDVQKRIKRESWTLVVHKMGFPSILSHNKKKELDKQLADVQSLPDFTLENIFGLYKKFSDDFVSHMNETVIELFDALVPRSHRFSGEYKTNKKTEVGAKVIMTNMLTNSFGLRINSYQEQKITMLDNVFSLLDGKGPVKTYYGPLYDAIYKCISGRETVKGETEYFRFKGFKAGTLHVEFKRLDLLQKLNEIGGGKRLVNREQAAA